MMVRILVIDNYDSFVYNIVQYLAELGAEVEVLRNDSPSIDSLAGKMDGYVISPGPGHPRSTRASLEVVRSRGYGRPVLGICLGHQAIAYVMGGKVVKARKVVHGKVSRIFHTSEGILEDIPNPLFATRYHSLTVDRNGLPPNIKITAETEDGEIMGIQVDGSDMFGLQFHPESVLTQYGRQILANFLRRCEC